MFLFIKLASKQIASLYNSVPQHPTMVVVPEESPWPVGLLADTTCTAQILSTSFYTTVKTDYNCKILCDTVVEAK